MGQMQSGRSKKRHRLYRQSREFHRRISFEQLASLTSGTRFEVGEQRVGRQWWGDDCLLEDEHLGDPGGERLV